MSSKCQQHLRLETHVCVEGQNITTATKYAGLISHTNVDFLEISLLHCKFNRNQSSNCIVTGYSYCYYNNNNSYHRHLETNS